MEKTFSEDGVGAVSSCNSLKAWLLFFVDGQDETAKNIKQVLEYNSKFLRENKFVVLSTPTGSDLHLQFQAIYGPTTTNTITFVANGGAAVLRWAGNGDPEDLIRNLTVLNNHSSTQIGEFGYPSEVCLRELMLDHLSEEKVVLANGSDGSHKSVESVRNDTEPLGKKPQTQPREQTVLQIRSPDGFSVTETFRTASLLSEVREMIATRFSMSDGFGLATSFPRYHYVSQDYNRSLEELNLWPNAVLMIVPVAPREVNKSTSLWYYTGTFSNWAHTIIMYMWSRVRSVFSFSGRENSRPAITNIMRQPDSQPGPSVSRRHGNIHTLRDTDKDDDKRRTTYNGNSTQQL